jgi:LAO/AO transport system kinase
MKIGVVAVDPSSVQTGGAILGDRIRMQEHTHDENVFIRSLASRGQVGGLSRSASRVIDVLDAAGMDVILVETVGAGQSEIEVAEIATIRVVVVQPSAGDGIQALKAGILEIADFIVVNKSDLPGADACEHELRQSIKLRTGAGRNVEFFQTVAITGAGVITLGEKLVSLAAAAAPDSHSALNRTRRLLVREACRQLEDELMTKDGPEMDRLLGKIMKADIALEQAATKVLCDGMFRQ